MAARPFATVNLTAFIGFDIMDRTESVAVEEYTFGGIGFLFGSNGIDIVIDVFCTVSLYEFLLRQSHVTCRKGNVIGHKPAWFARTTLLTFLT